MKIRKFFLLSLGVTLVGLLVPVTSSFACVPTRQWVWDAEADYTVGCTPIVINLTDDNGNGVIDACDDPEVAFITAGGRLIVVDGTTGNERFVMDENLADAALAAADLVGNSVPELIAIKEVGEDSFRIVAFDTTGTEVVTGDPAPAPGGKVAYLTISVADLNKDGAPEILVGATVFRGNTGELLWEGTGGQGRFQEEGPSRSSTGVDLDLDDTLEVLAGNTAYRWGGDIFWQFWTPDSADGASAVGNYDSDSFPEVVFVSVTQTIYLLDSVETSTPVLLDSYDFEYTLRIGVVFPALGQLDDDSVPEVAETNGDSLFGFDFDTGSKQWVRMWAVNILDDSRTKSGLSMADLDGDGYDEIVYRNHDTLRIIDRSGNVVWQTPMGSGTGMEYPAIADIDGDNQLEVVTPGSDIGYTRGVSAFECSTWVDGRRVWNDYTYHVTNINEDGTVPVNQDPSWLTHNSFLAQENECVGCDIEVSGDWTIEIVDPQSQGPYNAIGLWYDTHGNPYPRISYRVDEGIEKGLWYAWKDPDPLCRLNPGWSLLALDTSQDGRGAWTSIGIQQITDPDGAWIHVSYTDTVSGDRMIFRNVRSRCDLEAAVDTVDNQQDLGTFGTDIATNDSLISVVYYDATNGDLKYAEAYPAAGSWSTVTVDSGGARDDDVGRYAAIAIDGSGKRHVSYYDATNGDLKYSLCDPSKGSCTLPRRDPRSGWITIEVADSTPGTDVGLFTEIAVDQDNVPHISYIDSTNSSLKYAALLFGWDKVTVDVSNDLIASTSIGLDQNGKPRISYSDRTNKTVKYAHCTIECDDSANWDQVTVPDVWSDVGLWNSIAVDLADTIHISYSASDSLCEFKALKYAKGKP